MENELLSPQPNFKLYSARAIFGGTFLGGPLAAGYLIATNFKNLGQFQKSRIAWVIAIFVTLIIIAIPFWVPNFEKMPKFALPLIYTFSTQFIVQKFQGELIKTHIEEGGDLFSAWRVLLVGVIGLFVLVFLILFVVSLKDIAEAFLK